MTSIELVKSFKGCYSYPSCHDCPIKEKINKTDFDCPDFMMKLSKEAIEELESDNEKLRKIVNILCDTISQLIE